VGTPAAAQARIMVEHAHRTGARTFAVVYADKRSGAVEAGAAFGKHVERLGGQLVTSVILDPDKNSYAQEVNSFNSACSSGRCDFVLLAMEPYTAKKWLQGGALFGRLLTGGISMMFSERFAQDCILLRGEECNGMYLWHPFLPPIGDAASDPEVAAYVDAIRSVEPGVDVHAAYLQRTYVGTRLLVRAVQEVGARLTRTRLQQRLDAMTYESSLVGGPQDWGTSGPASRVANTWMRAYTIRAEGGSFAGFAKAQDWLRDPLPGVWE
jgi:ABC-type branched-subunit amino acid transport system substrate-binding protein